MNALIIGASRGIGLGLAREFIGRGATVTGTARDPARATELAATGATVIPFDLDDPAQIDALPGALGAARLDIAVLNAGVSGPEHRSAQHATPAELGALFFTNAVAPVRLARGLAPLVTEGTGVIGFMTSVLGSVGGNAGGGHELYRASKAALNSLTRGFVAEVAPRSLTVLSLHPGWVRTEMGGENAAIDVETSVRGLADRLMEAAGTHRHRFVDYAGAEIMW